MKLTIKHYLGMVITISVIGIAFFFFKESLMLYFLIAIAVVIGGIPFIFDLIFEQGAQREKEERFLSFSRDLVENVKSGTPISKSIINLRKRDYGPLSSHVEKLSNQITIGLTLNEALITFAKETKSVAISRAVGLISEAERAGGKIETILEAVAKSINQTENLKKERKAAISNLVTQGYMIFFVFIVIMLILEFKILPLVSDLSAAEGLALNVRSVNAVNFSMPLFLMLIIQSTFAGLVIGKISEGALKAGIKHSFILTAVTILITTGTRALVG